MYHLIYLRNATLVLDLSLLPTDVLLDLNICSIMDGNVFLELANTHHETCQGSLCVV